MNSFELVNVTQPYQAKRIFRNQITAALSLVALTKDIATREWEDKAEEDTIDAASVQHLQHGMILLTELDKLEDQV